MRQASERLRSVWSHVRGSSWFLGIGSAVLLLTVIGLLSAYATPGSWRITSFIRDRLPFPLATVGIRPVATFRGVANDLSAVRRFYEGQDFGSVGLRVDFSTEEGMKRLKVREREIVNRSLENEAVYRLAEREGVNISDTQVERAVSEQLNAEGNDVNAVEQRLRSLYGWGISEFTEKVVRPALFEEELRNRFDADKSRFSDARAKADEAAKWLRDGRAFSDTAVEFSRGRTADEGGSIGWFEYADLAEELREAARTQKVGVSGDVVESGLGFHILLVNGRKTENGKEFVDLSQIFVPKQTFGDWIAEELRNLPVHILSPDYEWDKEKARVEFRDPGLREFEANLLTNSEGDASVIF